MLGGLPAARKAAPEEADPDRRIGRTRQLNVVVGVVADIRILGIPRAVAAVALRYLLPAPPSVWVGTVPLSWSPAWIQSGSPGRWAMYSTSLIARPALSGCQGSPVSTASGLRKLAPPFDRARSIAPDFSNRHVSASTFTPPKQLNVLTRPGLERPHPASTSASYWDSGC